MRALALAALAVVAVLALVPASSAVRAARAPVFRAGYRARACTRRYRYNRSARRYLACLAGRGGGGFRALPGNATAILDNAETLCVASGTHECCVTSRAAADVQQNAAPAAASRKRRAAPALLSVLCVPAAPCVAPAAEAGGEACAQFTMSCSADRSVGAAGFARARSDGFAAVGNAFACSSPTPFVDFCTRDRCVCDLNTPTGSCGASSPRPGITVFRSGGCCNVFRLSIRQCINRRRAGRC